MSAHARTNRPAVVIVGGGIVGLACARELDARGVLVDVVEAGTPGQGATSAAAGMLSPIAEAAEPASVVQMGLRSLELWPDFSARVAVEGGIPLPIDRAPTLIPAFEGSPSSSPLEAAADSLGLPWEHLDHAALRQRYPELTTAAHSGLLLPSEARVDPRTATRALTASLHRRGVPVHRRRGVERIEIAGRHVRLSGPGFRLETEQVVIAAGAWSGQLPGLPQLPVRPVRGQMIAYDGLTWGFRGRIRHGHSYAVLAGNARARGVEGMGHDESGSLLVGATVEEAGFDAEPTPEARLALVEAAQLLFPRLRWKAVARQWAGLRPATPDGLPILGRLEGTSVVYATGHYRNGILLAPITAEAVANLIMGEAIPNVAAWSPQRFL